MDDSRLLTPEEISKIFIDNWAKQPHAETWMRLAAQAQLDKVLELDRGKIISLIKKAIMDYNQDPNPENAFDYYVPDIADQIIATCKGGK